ncbi:MAG: HAD family phosphatase, partial [Peptococcaceae bacterium]|nr:HAD family phosphatase [Peptococcaceae bacterium]
MQGAIFDLDGTLVDSMPMWDAISGDYLRSQGIQPREDLFEHTRLMNLHQSAVYFQQAYGLALSVPEIAHGVNALLANFYQNVVQAKAGVRE